MAFRFKDLVVDLGALEGPVVCQGNSVGCFAATCKAHSLCAFGSQACTITAGCIQNTLDLCMISRQCVPTVVIDDPQVPIQVLASLKKQLQLALEDIAVYEKDLQTHLQPRTLEEAELVEKKLEGALEELKAQKKTLSRKK